MSSNRDRGAEDRFVAVFSHLAAVVAYARRRGAPDPDGAAAETMAVAWRRLPDVPGDALPWLLATARNVVHGQLRRDARFVWGDEPECSVPFIEPESLAPELARALRALAPIDREALLLVAWDDLTPARAARALGISPVAFRVRLHRARRRIRTELEHHHVPPQEVSRAR